MTAIWTIGAGGLLGSAVVRAAEREGLRVWRGDKIAWASPDAVDQLRAQLTRFVEWVGDGPWQVLWCAGAAVTDSSAERLESEFQVLDGFLHAVAGLDESVTARGVVVFASSAGAVFGGSVGAPFTESSPPVPLGDYGRAKLRAEEAFRSLAAQGVRTVVARIANLYGPGQSLEKQQGLISRLCLSALTRTALSVFVALDTRRDYIFVDDCASRLLATAAEARRHESRFHLKIIGTGTAVSVAAILGQFQFVRVQRPLVVMGASPASMLQGRDLRLRSEVWTHLDRVPTMTLPEGVAITLEDLRRSIARSGH